MIQRALFSLLLLFGSLGFVQAQDKLLTIEDATSRNPKLFPSTLSQWQWFGANNRYVYVAANALVAGNPTSTAKDTLVKLTQINEKLAASKGESLKRFPSISVVGNHQFYFTSGTTLWMYDLENSAVTSLNAYPKEVENVDIDEVGYTIAYTKNNNLYISIQGKEVAVTQDTNSGILYGASNVHRNEFGISKGTFWSPKGDRLAFYRMDQSMVTDYPLVNIATRIATLEASKYPMAGMSSHQVTLGVYQINSGKTIYLDTHRTFEQELQVDDKNQKIDDHYLTNVTWSPDGKFIYIAELNRDQNHMYLNKYDATTGKLVKTLFEESNSSYVEPVQGPYFMHENPNQFVWQSQRDGYNHLYLYDSEGKLIKQLTKGSWVVKGIISSDVKGSTLFFMGNKENPLDNILYAVDVKSGEIKRLTPDNGTHTCNVSADGTYILDQFSSLSVASMYVVLNNKGAIIETVVPNKNPLEAFKLGETSLFSIKGENGVDLWCRLIKPIDFNPQKKYPVIIYVYGGPHSQLVTDTWLGGGGFFLNYLATKGYVVFTLDNRGTSNRGLAFEQAIFRNLGTAEVADQMSGVAYLKSLTYVDSTRIGINGWSYGGFMGMTMLLRNPGVFKTVVVGGPVIDWKFYEVMYGERYMDTPESNPEGYKTASLLNYTQNLKSKLLIIQGYQDGTVVPQNGLSFIKKCVDENIQVDYFIYPGHEHNVRGKDRVHLNQKIVNYFEDYLK